MRGAVQAGLGQVFRARGLSEILRLDAALAVVRPLGHRQAGDWHAGCSIRIEVTSDGDRYGLDPGSVPREKGASSSRRPSPAAPATPPPKAARIAACSGCAAAFASCPGHRLALLLCGIRCRPALLCIPAVRHLETVGGDRPAMVPLARAPGDQVRNDGMSPRERSYCDRGFDEIGGSLQSRARQTNGRSRLGTRIVRSGERTRARADRRRLLEGCRLRAPSGIRSHQSPARPLRVL